MKYAIYATPGCGYCLQAKRLLESKGIDYDYVQISDLDDNEKAHLMEIAGIPFRTVPQIFETNENNQLLYIGGFTELREVFEDKDKNEALDRQVDLAELKGSELGK